MVLNHLQSVPVTMRFNPPPNWPTLPVGLTPTSDWEPDPAWGPAPEGWNLWVDDPAPPLVPPASEQPGAPQPAAEISKRGLASLAALILLPLVVVAVVVSPDEPASAKPTQLIPPAERPQVVFDVDGTATGADLTFSSGGGIQQAAGKAVPLTNTETGAPGFRFTAPSSGTPLYLSAQNTGDSGSITCRITVGDRVISENTSDGGYTITTCQGMTP